MVTNLTFMVVQVRRDGSSVTSVLIKIEDGSLQIINLREGSKVILTISALFTLRIL